MATRLSVRQWRPEVTICPTCGAEFTQVRWGQKYCDLSCRSKRKNPAWNRAGSVAARRRRRLRHATTWDGVTDAEILERDRWTCGICRKRIGKSFRYPHPRSASVDHLLPLSLGGDDTALNKRATHLSCNISRNAGKPGEQLPLPFGLEGILPPPRKERPARLCETCGEPLAGRKCRLHTQVRYQPCAHCERPFPARGDRQRFCRTLACAQDRRAVAQKLLTGDARERKREKDRERMRELRATQEGRERIAAIKQRYTDRQWDTWLAGQRERGRSAVA